MLQLREAEERRGRGAKRELDGAVALFDLVLDGLLVQFLRVQVGMRPGVRADGVTGCRHLPENLGMKGGMLADREEHRLGALVGQRLEHRRRVDRPRTVIEGQHHFLVAEKIDLLEMFETEAGSDRGVDFNDAGNTERIGIGAGLLRLRCGSCRRFFRNAAGGLDRVAAGQRLCMDRGGRCLRGGESLRSGELRCEFQNQPPVAINVAAAKLISIRPNALRMVTLSLLPKLKLAPCSLWERVVNAPQTPDRFLMSHRPWQWEMRRSIGHECAPMTGGARLRLMGAHRT